MTVQQLINAFPGSAPSVKLYDNKKEVLVTED